MPSGGKKRKAAKKKKEKKNTINPQGNGELKSQDEKGSDGGEGSSPAYHDHDDHHHPFNGGSEEVEEGDPSAVQPPASDAKCMEEIPSDIKIDEVAGGNEASVVMIERDLKSEESSEADNVSFEHIETAKESYYGNAGGTSNGESFTEKNSKDENYSSIEEAIACHELVDSSTSKMTFIAENALTEEAGNSASESYVKPVKPVASMSDIENSETQTVSLLQEKSVVPPLGVTDLAVKINEDSVSPLTDEKARISGLEEPMAKEYDGKVLASLSSSPSTKLTNGAEHIEDSETPACSENQPTVVSTHMVQKTPWWSCCGLFEVLPVSNR